MGTVAIKNNVLEQFEKQFKTICFGTEIDSIRKNSLEKFIQVGFPTKKTEEYKYIPIEKNVSQAFLFSENSDLQSSTSCILINKEIEIEIVNGSLISNEEVDNDNYYIAPIALAIKKYSEKIQQHFLQSTKNSTDAFALLNNALATNVLFILVKQNAVVEKAICVFHIISANEAFINQRSLVIVESGAKCTFFENYISSNQKTSIYNAVTEVFVEPNANLHYIKNQFNNTNLVFVNNHETTQRKNSVSNNYTFTINGGLTRNNTNVSINDEHCESHLFGIYVANNESIIDNHTLVDHKFPNCNSNELYKGIANDKATTVFNGKIFVRKDAQKTNAFQSNKNILLSDDAIVNTKPQLEIYADDVKCSHGTSTGKLDENALFYLKARGIGELSAKKLLLQAFVNEACEPIKQNDIKEYILNALHASIL